jgi:hypothetical protein
MPVVLLFWKEVAVRLDRAFGSSHDETEVSLLLGTTSASGVLPSYLRRNRQHLLLRVRTRARRHCHRSRSSDRIYA